MKGSKKEHIIEIKQEHSSYQKKPQEQLEKDLLQITHSQIANSPLWWLYSAYCLLCSSNLLEKNILKLKKNYSLPLFSLNLNAPISYYAKESNFMLLGFFIENLLKACAVLQGHRFLVNSRFTDIPNSASHDLIQYSNQFKISYSKNEGRFLKEINKYMVGYGRYPITRKPSYIVTNYQGEYNSQDQSFQSICIKIITNIESVLQKWPDKDEVEQLIIMITRIKKEVLHLSK